MQKGNEPLPALLSITQELDVSFPFEKLHNVRWNGLALHWGGGEGDASPYHPLIYVCRPDERGREPMFETTGDARGTEAICGGAATTQAHATSVLASAMPRWRTATTRTQQSRDSRRCGATGGEEAAVFLQPFRLLVTIQQHGCVALGHCIAAM
jgi:hypothetical protein